MKTNAEFLSEVIEEALRKYPNNLEQFLWYICEASNLPRCRSRYISQAFNLKPQPSKLAPTPSPDPDE